MHFAKSYGLSVLLFMLLGAMAACGPAPNAVSNSAPEIAPVSAEPTTQQVAVAPQSFAPRIKLDPPSGEAGNYVQIAGSGWPANMSVIFMLTDPSGISTTIATQDTDGDGNLATGFLYPVDRRWSVQQSYIVHAQSADGQYQAGANYVVIDPNASAGEAATATPVVIALATATVTPIPTALPTDAPTVVPTAPPAAHEETQPQSAAPPVIQASLVPLDDGQGRRGQRANYRLEFAASDDHFAQVTTLLLIPALDPNANIRLEVDDDTEIEIKGNRVKISAPNPQQLLESIQQRGGIEVRPGQHIEYHPRGNNEIKIEFDGGSRNEGNRDRDSKLEIEGATLQLQVTAIDHTGQSQQITLTPPVSEPSPPRGPEQDDHRHNDDKHDPGRPDDNRGRDHHEDDWDDNDGDDHDDDHDNDHDDD